MEENEKAREEILLRARREGSKGQDEGSRHQHSLGNQYGMIGFILVAGALLITSMIAANESCQIVIFALIATYLTGNAFADWRCTGKRSALAGFLCWGLAAVAAVICSFGIILGQM